MTGIVEVRGVRIGEGTPVICVPVIGRTEEEVAASVKQVKLSKPDVIEWRVDWFLKENENAFLSIKKVLTDIRGAAGNTPLLFTVRTVEEGGEVSLSPECYERLNRMAVGSGNVDLIDIELSKGEEIVSRLIEEAHICNIKAVVSSHDFQRTPEKEEIVKKLCRMKSLGADLPKVAVMPRDREDLLTLLVATQEADEKCKIGPVITMSMGKTGMLSRCCGEIFGSALTFASAGRASAPGQIPVEDLRVFLKMFHTYGGSEN